MFLFEGVVHPAELEQRLVQDLAATGIIQSLQYSTLGQPLVHSELLDTGTAQNQYSIIYCTVQYGKT